MEMTIKKRGSLPALQLSVSTLQEAGLRIGQKVSVHAERGRIVIAPLCAFSLEELVAGITKDNQHAESDSSEPVGEEIFSAPVS